MKAVVYQEKGRVALCEIPMPRILDPRDAIVRVTLASICASDLHIRAGAVPRAKVGTALGHEFVGVVEEVGSAVKRFSVGDRVAVNVETFCGDCFFCRRGFVNNCTSGGWELGCRINGGQAEFCRVPLADNGLNLIPPDVTNEQALLVGDVLATGYWAAEQGEIRPADVVCVLGAGPTGLCTMMSARLYGPAKLIAIDVSNERLALAKTHGLCDVTVNPTTEDALSVVRECTNGRGADVVFEVAGAKNTFQTAWQLARPNAVVVVVALYESPQTLPLNEMYGKNLTFKTGGVDANKCADILRLIAAGMLDTTYLLTHRVPLNDVMGAYETFAAQRDGCVKVAVTPYDHAREGQDGKTEF